MNNSEVNNAYRGINSQTVHTPQQAQAMQQARAAQQAQAIQQPRYEEIEIKNKKRKEGSYYDGTVLGGLGCIAVKGVLALALPWADCVGYDYHYSHTSYNGKRLKYAGNGGMLFIERFKWIFLFIITFGIYGFWIPARKQQFHVSQLYFEDEKHITDESFFTGSVLGTWGVNLFCNLLSIMSLGLLLPFAMCYKERWYAKHTVVNKKRFVFTGKALDLIGHYLLWWFLTIITFGIYGFWIPVKLRDWKAKHTHIKLVGEPQSNTSTAPLVFGIVLLIIFIVIIFIALSSFKDANGKGFFENIINIIYPRAVPSKIEDDFYRYDYNEYMYY